MTQPRDTTEPEAGQAVPPPPSATTATRQRPRARRGTPRPPKPAAAAPAPAAAENAAQPPRAGTPAGSAPSSAPLGTDSGAAALAGSAGMLGATMMALSSISAQFGGGQPTAETGQPYAPPTLPSDAPTVPVLWDGNIGSGYGAASATRAGGATAMEQLNAELGQLLRGSTDDTARGRAAMAAILADVDAAITALGPLENTTTGRQLLSSTLSNALQRANSTLGQGQSTAGVTADKVQALADHYLQSANRTGGGYAGAARGSGGPPLARPSGQMGQWIGDALQILQASGVDPQLMDPAAIAAIIDHESAGNPNAINNWDSNAAAGHPSKGLMQTIDPTFNAYALPGHTNVWNPVDNIIAGVRYAIHRYGSLDNVPGIVNLHHGGHYVGY
ncbi:transglycosylase SLT domain-containing protein [Nocardia sp. alder85J]|uniref:lytic transglycosylase domain-containing protein n=1 Tax=Nocardia sp. alder85J TaxID=2862949 RepID=UPI001CD49DE9|nr:transglycosylase SLT domain-containing protein [Nocardia sp. alder85J]MCX4092171.1 transglycosylase SLT domain-containing protein [Nocardia sp. alder85J]